MKRPFILTAALFSMLAFVSCSNDDDGSKGGGKTGTIKANFFPSHDDNYWIYDISTRIEGQDTQSATDSLYVEVDSEKKSKFILNVNEGPAYQPNSSINRFLQGKCSKTPTSLSVQGGILSVGLFEGIEVPEEVSLKLVDIEAKKGSQLSSFKNEFEQKIEGYPFKLSYEYLTNQVEFFEKYTVGDKEYDNVAISTLTLKLEASFHIEEYDLYFPILESQDAMKIQSIYVDDLGLVRSENKIAVNVNPAVLKVLKDQYDIDVPEEIEAGFNATEVQTLKDYKVVLKDGE